MKIDLFKKEKEIQKGRKLLVEPSLSLNQENLELEIHYSPISKNAMFDLCDMNGSIISTGKIENSEPIFTSVKNLKKGVYRLCVLDGEDIIEQQLHIP